MLRSAVVAAAALATTAPAAAATAAPLPSVVQRAAVTWHDADWPAELGTMPLGNGDVSANAWVERDTGDLLVYLAKSDAFDINALPIKVGRLRLSFSPPLWTPATGRNGSWAQTLTVANGTVSIQGDTGYSVHVVVDANAPVLRVSADRPAGLALHAALELVHAPSNWYRNISRPYHDLSRLPDSPLGPFNASAPNTNANGFGAYCLERFLEPDTVVGAAELSGCAVSDEVSLQDSVVWYHRNIDTAPAHGVPTYYENVMRTQGLDPHAFPDPLLGRTFGAAMGGDGETF